MEYPYAKQYAWRVRKKAMFATAIMAAFASLLFFIPAPPDGPFVLFLAWVCLAILMLTFSLLGVIGTIAGIVKTILLLLDDDPTDPGPLW